MQENRNLLLALAVSLLIMLAFDFFYLKPAKEEQARQAQLNAQQSADMGLAALQQQVKVTPVFQSRAEVLSNSGQRINIISPRINGSISLTGARIDDVVLADYNDSLEDDASPVTLLQPRGTGEAYYAEFNWLGLEGDTQALPSATTVWKADKTELRPGEAVTLTWDNGSGLLFTKVIGLDKNYMFTITQTVKSQAASPVVLAPYGLISREGRPETSGFYILHEGALGVFDGVLEEIDYDDMEDDPTIELKSSDGGWLGITDKYWLVAMIPDQEQNFVAHTQHRIVNGKNRYQVDFMGMQKVLAPGQTMVEQTSLFAGAKEVSLIDKYESSMGISNFDLAIDWGWFYWLTRPIFYALDHINDYVGNFGVSILVLTVLIKILFFPLANKSYRALGKMKLLAPKMKEIREKYAEDKVKQQQATMELYKTEKINPLAGCLPILLQIPVFFSLYKVLFVTIEMRHAPFFGWVNDLSAPDTLTFVNLFGLIPWDPPSFMVIGIWPILMGLSMYGQQKLNPAPADPMQAKLFMFMPLIFVIILAPFPVGLVIYWTWNNVLTIAQQYVIMRREGAVA